MSELIAVAATAFLCGSGIILARHCRMRADVNDVSPQYLLVRKDHYEILEREAKRKIIIEQPQLPDYSEKAPLLSLSHMDDTISI
jgi:hypothetical protein